MGRLSIASGPRGNGMTLPSNLELLCSVDFDELAWAAVAFLLFEACLFVDQPFGAGDSAEKVMPVLSELESLPLFAINLDCLGWVDGFLFFAAGVSGGSSEFSSSASLYQAGSFGPINGKGLLGATDGALLWGLFAGRRKFSNCSNNSSA